MHREDILKVLEQTEALLTGHFELRSKLHSDKYFQFAKVLCYPRHAEDLCRALVSKMRDQLGSDLNVDSVISPALGGIVVGHEVARQFGTRAIFAEKENDVLKLRRFDIAEGERVVVAEDVITRGGRVRETVDIVEARGGEVVAIGLLLDRSGGKVAFDYPTVSLLEIEPRTYEPADCPLCADGLPLVHPGGK
jgi:orotate phosphoribosyltransferase